MKHSSIAFLLMLLMHGTVFTQTDSIDYLGQKKAGYFPEIFAGEITNGVTEYCHSFSPDGKEFYFAIYESGEYTIKYMEKVGETWSEKKLASFCSTQAGVQEASPCFSPDGKKLFYISNRTDGLGDWDIWYVERTDTGWGAPINPGSPLNSASYEDYPFLGKDSVFYFNSTRYGGSGNLDMYRATYANGIFENVTNLGDSINSSTYDENPVVIGDKLIFGNRDKRTLNVCYKAGDTNWSKPEIISGGTYQNGVYYGFRSSPDDKYFFFGRSVGPGTAKEYWVDIESLDYLGVKEAPFNYITSWYAGDSIHMKLALHPKLVKRRVVTTSDVRNVTYDWMINAVQSGTGKIGSIKQAQKDIQILDHQIVFQTDTLASVKITSNNFVDYLHLAMVNNQWKIVNVLWEYKTTAGNGTAEGATNIVNEYMNSWNTGDSVAMSTILLPDFAGRMTLSVTEVEDVDYNWMINEMKNCLGRSVITGAKVKTIEVLNTCATMASVKIRYDDYIEYLHLSYVNNQWYIVNSLRNFYVKSKNNFPPYIKWPLASQKATKGVIFIFTVPDSTFDDKDNDSLTYSATLSTGKPLPGWLSFNPATRTFSGVTPSASNLVKISVIATDPAKASAVCPLIITIINPTGVEEDNDQLPKESMLYQNYPNPFNPSTTIVYDVSHRGLVKLTVYDLLGREVTVLVNEDKSPGSYTLKWDAENMSSGMYFCRLIAGGFSQTRKLIVEK